MTSGPGGRILVLMSSYVYQLIVHEYNSDDGHYQDRPFGATVFVSEAKALDRRDRFNTRSVTDYNADTVRDVVRRTKIWEENGGKKGEPKPINERGTQRWDPYTQRGIANFAAEHTFSGSPTDIDAIERFVGYRNPIDYYTVETLEVIE